MTESNCLACGATYTRNKGLGTCSTACYMWRRKHPDVMRIPAPCVTCGEPTGKGMAGRYCSSDCQPMFKRGKVYLPPVLRRTVKTCAYCATEFVTQHLPQRFCTSWCPAANTARPGSYDKRIGRSCLRCGAEIPKTDRINKFYCSVSCQCCTNQDLRRARKRGLPVEVIDRGAVFQRDGFTCHICDGAVVDEAPVIDHIIPLCLPDSPGHVTPNVATAHAHCNQSKGGRVRPEDYLLHALLVARLGGDAQCQTSIQATSAVPA